jgi:hypothetical protein
MRWNPFDIARAALTLQREARIDEGAANGLGVFFGYTAGAQGLVPRRLDSRLHVLDDLLRFVLIEQKARMLRENVLRIGVAAASVKVSRNASSASLSASPSPLINVLRKLGKAQLAHTSSRRPVYFGDRPSRKRADTH